MAYRWLGETQVAIGRFLGVSGSQASSLVAGGEAEVARMDLVPPFLA